MEKDLENLQSKESEKQKFQKRLLDVLDSIDMQTKEIKYFYKGLKKVAHNVDSNCLDIINSRIVDIESSLEDKEALMGRKVLENEKKELQLEKIELEDTLEFPLIAKKLLIDLQEEKCKLIGISEKYNKTIQKDFLLEIEEDSDIENYYSSEQLGAYLDSLMLKNIGIEESCFLLSVEKNIDSELNEIVYLFGRQEYLSIDKISEMSVKLFNRIGNENKIEDYNNIRSLSDLFFHMVLAKIKKLYEKY